MSQIMEEFNSTLENFSLNLEFLEDDQNVSENTQKSN